MWHLKNYTIFQDCVAHTVSRYDVNNKVIWSRVVDCYLSTNSKSIRDAFYRGYLSNRFNELQQKLPKIQR